MNRKEIIGALVDMSTEELRELNQMICKIIRADQVSRIQAAKCKFNVGSSVTFNDKLGRTISGQVIKVNRKNVVVRAADGVRWTVTPTLLKTA